MKIEDLSRILEVLEPVETNKRGVRDGTQEFKELCAEMVDLTQGPTTLYEVVPDQAVIAIHNVVQLDGVQASRVRKIIRNTIHVTIGTLLSGGVLKVTTPASEVLKSLAQKLLEELEAGDKGGSTEESEEEEELDDEPTPKKEVIH